MKILVTGGAGYIGGFMTQHLLDNGHEVVVVDNLERGHDKIDDRAKFIQGELRDKEFVTELFQNNQFDGIIHFAAYISMGESMQNPFIYFQNNVQASLNIIEAAANAHVNKFIFSSTAGVYGNPMHVPIPEDHPKNPENPYGESKLIVERILSWYNKTKGMSFACLRYFNAAGASPDANRGENHHPESHLIPNIMLAVLENRPFKLFGNDYQTPDGTCVRDYIHVLDLVKAHMLALEKLDNTPGGYYYNVGTGIGHSNKEVIDMVKIVIGRDFQVETVERRPGDANELVADVKKVKQDLGFEPQYSDLRTIVETAWNWHQKQPKSKASA